MSAVFPALISALRDIGMTIIDLDQCRGEVNIAGQDLSVCLEHSIERSPSPVEWICYVPGREKKIPARQFETTLTEKPKRGWNVVGGTFSLRLQKQTNVIYFCQRSHLLTLVCFLLRQRAELEPQPECQRQSKPPLLVLLRVLLPLGASNRGSKLRANPMRAF